MEEPLNLVKLTELMQLERRSRALISRRSEIFTEVESAIGSGDIQQEDAERARQMVRDIIFLRRRKIMLIAADIYNGGQPEAKGLTAGERSVLSKAVALLRESDPFNDTAESAPSAGARAPESREPAEETASVEDPASEGISHEETAGAEPVDPADPEHVILRALEKIDFVSLERTYMVDVDDVFTVDSGTADILTKAGKAVRVASGDA
jgi:DNA replication initiation complex subunit (GINS family)